MAKPDQAAKAAIELEKIANILGSGKDLSVYLEKVVESLEKVSGKLDKLLTKDLSFNITTPVTVVPLKFYKEEENTSEVPEASLEEEDVKENSAEVGAETQG